MKDSATETTTITVHVPMRFTIRCGRKTVISDLVRSPSQSKADNALAKALARAFRWRQQIESGEYGSITELAKSQRVNESYACRLLRLTLLAPSIVTDILNGSRELNVTLKDLTRPLPVCWEEQLKVINTDQLKSQPEINDGNQTGRHCDSVSGVSNHNRGLAGSRQFWI